MHDNLITLYASILSVSFLMIGFFDLLKWLKHKKVFEFFLDADGRACDRIASSLQFSIDMLRAGDLPDFEKIFDSLEGRFKLSASIRKILGLLRERGCSVIPTAERLKLLILSVKKINQQSRKAMMGPIYQSVLMASLIPLIGVLIVFLFDSVWNEVWTWGAISFVCFAWVVIGIYWIVVKSKLAASGGLKGAQVAYVELTLLSGEFLIAQISAGDAPELAFEETFRFQVENLQERSYSLLWGGCVWAESNYDSEEKKRKDSLALVTECIEFVKILIRNSARSGRNVIDAIEIQLRALSENHQSLVSERVSRLETQLLLPLFLFVAPAVLIQLSSVVVIILGQME